jgi:hypothetical protein
MVGAVHAVLTSNPDACVIEIFSSKKKTGISSNPKPWSLMLRFWSDSLRAYRAAILGWKQSGVGSYLPWLGDVDGSENGTTPHSRCSRSRVWDWNLHVQSRVFVSKRFNGALGRVDDHKVEVEMFWDPKPSTRMGVALGMVGEHQDAVQMFKTALDLGDPREAEVLSPRNQPWGGGERESIGLTRKELRRFQH